MYVLKMKKHIKHAKRCSCRVLIRQAECAYLRAVSVILWHPRKLRDLNPVPTGPLANDITTAPSGLVAR